MAEITKERLLRDFSKAVLNDEAALFIGAGMSVGAGFVDCNYSGCFGQIGEERAALEGAAEAVEHIEAVLADG